MALFFPVYQRCLYLSSEGIDVKKLNDRQLARIRNQKMGFVMQDFALLPKLSVYENIAIPLYLSPNSSIRKIHEIPCPAYSSQRFGTSEDFI